MKNLIVVALLCFIPSAAASQNRSDQEKVPSSGNVKIDIGGYRLQTVVSGSGKPSVVFESGMGESYETWKQVQPSVAGSTRTFSYDRAGLGESDPSPRPRDALSMAKELHAALRKARVPGPYILVGHSLGGWIITIFAHLYPKEVVGLVLVDPAYQEPRLRAKLTEQEWAVRERAIQKYTPPMTKYQQLERDTLDLSGEQALQAFPLPRVPTILLTGMLVTPGFPSSEMEREVKMQVHKEWIAKMPETVHILVPESRHYIQNDAPTKVISAIEEILAKIRRTKSVASPK